jgi:hypothetical protein
MSSYGTVVKYKKDGKKYKYKDQGTRRTRLPGGSYNMSVFKKSRPGKLLQAVSWSKGAFPRELTTQMTYATALSLASSAGAAATWRFSVNCMRDPDTSGGGHQPRGFDTLCGADSTNAPYSNYYVRGASIKVEGMVTGPDSTGALSFLTITTGPPSTTGPIHAFQAIERADTICSPMSGLWYGGRPIMSLTQYANTAVLAGRKNGIDDPALSGSYATDPTENCVFWVGCCPADGTTAVTWKGVVTITYYVTFHHLNNVSNS